MLCENCARSRWEIEREREGGGERERERDRRSSVVPNKCGRSRTLVKTGETIAPKYRLISLESRQWKPSKRAIAREGESRRHCAAVFYCAKESHFEDTSNWIKCVDTNNKKKKKIYKNKCSLQQNINAIWLWIRAACTTISSSFYFALYGVLLFFPFGLLKNFHTRVSFFFCSWLFCRFFFPFHFIWILSWAFIPYWGVNLLYLLRKPSP